MRLLCPRHGDLVEIDLNAVRVYYAEDGALRNYYVEMYCGRCDDRVLSATLGKNIGYFPFTQPKEWPHPWPPNPDDREDPNQIRFSDIVKDFYNEEDPT